MRAHLLTLVLVLRHATLPLLASGLLLVGLLALSGCLSKSLAVPVEDHFLQTSTVADRCRVQDCDEDLQEDLDVTAKQACLLDAIVKKKDPTEHCAKKAGE